MELRHCWDWVQSFDLIPVLNWSQPMEFIQNTLICDTPKYYRKEWNQRSRESTDFAIVSKSGKGYKHWSHCHKNVLQSIIKNYRILLARGIANGREVQLDFDDLTVENVLRIIYRGEYDSVETIAENHHELLKFLDDLHLVPDRQKVARNYLRAEFHRFCFGDKFINLNELELTRYLNEDTLPLQTRKDIVMVLRCLFNWSLVKENNSFCSVAGILCLVLEKLHGNFNITDAALDRYVTHFADKPECKSRVGQTPVLDTVLVSSDGVEIRCGRTLLCSIPYFNMMLNNGFRETFQNKVSVNMDSSMLQLVIDALGADLPIISLDKLANVYTIFDYLQADDLLDKLDVYTRRNFLQLAKTSDFLNVMSPEMMQRVLPFFFQDMTDIFSLSGFTYVYTLFLRWLELDNSREDHLTVIMERTLDALDAIEASRKVVYESFDSKVHVFDGRQWSACHWGDFDSMRDGVYNFQVLRYKKKIITNNFLANNMVALRDCLAGSEVPLAKHPEPLTGYFVEMLDRVFCSVEYKHFMIKANLDLHEVDLPCIDGFPLEPRCADSQRRRIYFDTEKVLYCVELDENFAVRTKLTYNSTGITKDHHFHVIEGQLYAFRLGHESFALDEDLGIFKHIQSSLPNINGIIYKFFDLNDYTYLIVTEAVELTQARLRVSETESDPKVTGFFRWNCNSRHWDDITVSTGLPQKTQIQLTVVLNSPGVPLYARRPCYLPDPVFR